MAFRWKNITVTRTNCGADVFGLAGFLRDDDLICHEAQLGGGIQRHADAEHTMNAIDVQTILNPNRTSLGSCLRPCRRTELSLRFGTIDACLARQDHAVGKPR